MATTTRSTALSPRRRMRPVLYAYSLEIYYLLAYCGISLWYLASATLCSYSKSPKKYYFGNSRTCTNSSLHRDFGQVGSYLSTSTGRCPGGPLFFRWKAGVWRPGSALYFRLSQSGKILYPRHQVPHSVQAPRGHLGQQWSCRRPLAHLLPVALCLYERLFRFFGGQ